MLETVFSSFWTWLGTIGLILSIGFSIAMPIYYYGWLKKILLLNSLHHKSHKKTNNKSAENYF